MSYHNSVTVVSDAPLTHIKVYLTGFEICRLRAIRDDCSTITAIVALRWKEPKLSLSQAKDIIESL